MEQLDDTKPGPLLYGFYKSPALDVVTSWSKTYNASVAADYHMASLNSFLFLYAQIPLINTTNDTETSLSC